MLFLLIYTKFYPQSPKIRYEGILLALIISTPSKAVKQSDSQLMKTTKKGNK